MKKLLIIGLTLIVFTSQAQFNKNFHDKTLRIDYTHGGNHNTEHYFIDELMEEPHWGGSKTNLIDTFNYGNYFFKVFDLKTDELIYSRGYCTLFGEWQTIAEAKVTYKSFDESIVMPFPKEDVKVVFYSRDNKGEWANQFEYEVDVKSYFIRPNTKHQYPTYGALINGKPENKVDIVILPEGYTADEMDDFKKDCDLFVEFMFKFEPFAEYKDRFNITGVMAPSKESGSDVPGDYVYPNTVMNSSFYTFDSERYCMVEDFKTVRDLAANVAYDQIYILVNTEKYGGGGIFNFYSVSSIRNDASAKIVIHEFGHAFAGLGDEYYDSSTSYSEFYPTDIEPWEPNLTTLIDFDSKWKNLLKEGTPIPTPVNKKYMKKLGVFEGGGYSAKGIYRPKVDCLMHTFQKDEFCEACDAAIIRMINFYSK